MNRFSLRRLLVFFFLLLILLPTQALNLFALWLDKWFFAFRKIEPIEPIFVVGVPRSGTTFLHRLMAMDQPDLTTFRLWELLFAPAICQKLFFVAIGKADRLVGRPLFRLVRLIERIALGSFDAVHGTSLFDPEEDYLALLPFSGCFLLVLFFPFSEEIWRLVQRPVEEPGRGKNQPESDPERVRLMNIYHGLVQRHLYVFGKEKTFLSKNPSFTPLVPLLYRTFPTAKVIGCFRDPRQAIPSLLSSIESGARLVGNENNVDFQSRLVTMAKTFYELLLLRYVENKNYKLMDFASLTKNPSGSLKLICQELAVKKLVFHEKLEKACLTATNYNSKHRYEANQFGLDMQEIQLELKFVFDALQRTSLAQQQIHWEHR